MFAAEVILSKPAPKAPPCWSVPTRYLRINSCQPA